MFHYVLGEGAVDGQGDGCVPSTQDEAVCGNCGRTLAHHVDTVILIVHEVAEPFEGGCAWKRLTRVNGVDNSEGFPFTYPVSLSR